MSNEQAKEKLNVVIKGKKLIGDAQHFVAMEVLADPDEGRVPQRGRWVHGQVPHHLSRVERGGVQEDQA